MSPRLGSAGLRGPGVSAAASVWLVVYRDIVVR